jgi:flagellar biosynthetic protein FlhB
MAEENDDAQKTEDPTPRRQEEARKRGEIASSREINHWFMILGGTVGVMALIPSLGRGLVGTLKHFVADPDLIVMDRGPLGATLANMLGEVVMEMLPLIGILVVAALMAGIIQSGFIISFERIQPKLEKISVLKGAKRLFSLKSLVEFTKGLLKLVIVGTVVAMLLLPVVDKLAGMTMLTVLGLTDLLQSMMLRLFVGVLSVMTVIAGLDFLYQKFEHLKSLRMSRQEIRDELKQTEGDPHVKAKLRQIRTERARRRMMAAVPEADVVITNPTHFAVALKYDPEKMPAPKLVAKGADTLAARIRETAVEHEVPLVENPPLARALYDNVEIDTEIPPEHYKAVAEVISYVFQLKGRRMPA